MSSHVKKNQIMWTSLGEDEAYTQPMPLGPEEIVRRIRAARHLAGLDQKELGRLMKEDNFGAEDIGRIERREPDAPPFGPGRRAAVARHTGVPEAWFTEVDVSRLFREEQPNARLESLEGDVAALREELRATRNQVLARLAQVQGSQEGQSSPAETQPHKPGAAES